MCLGGRCFSWGGLGYGSVPSLFTWLLLLLQEEVRQAVTPAEPVQYYFTLAQQPAAVQVQGQQQGQQTTTSTTTIQPGQIIIAQPQQGQVRHKQHSEALQVSVAPEALTSPMCVLQCPDLTAQNSQYRPEVCVLFTTRCSDISLTRVI